MGQTFFTDLSAIEVVGTLLIDIIGQQVFVSFTHCSCNFIDFFCCDSDRLFFINFYFKLLQVVKFQVCQSYYRLLKWNT